MRWNFRVSLLCAFCALILVAFVSIGLFSSSGFLVSSNACLPCETRPIRSDELDDVTFEDRPWSTADGAEDHDDEDRVTTVSHVACEINGKAKRLRCLKDANEVYLPFHSFLEKYLEVFGNLVVGQNGEEHFEWWHSYAKISRPTVPYRWDGPFGPFGGYNVENRERVKLVSAIDGVPLSVQWGPKPYPYATQIAQFALEHYSKNMTDAPAIVQLIDDGESKERKRWEVPHEFGEVKYEWNDERKSSVIHLKTHESLEQAPISIDISSNDPRLKYVELSVRFLSKNASFTLVTQRTDSSQYCRSHFVRVDDVLNWSRKGEFFYGVGSPSRGSGEWRRFSRNAIVDTLKGLAAASGKKGKRVAPAADLFRLVRIEFHGELLVDDVRVASALHASNFLDGARWLLANQDGRGGWPTPVTRQLAERRLTLKPGWYSAMAQGHAISVLCRAFSQTADRRYIDAAVRATELFAVPAEEGGILNRFFDRVPWYEEYPTRPGTFVLNGFIYALVGLYDLAAAVPEAAAARLYRTGIESLRELLPLFDAGSTSVYDLRHVTLKVAPNLARWDYHSVHIYQLLWLYSLEPGEEVFREFAERWIRYAKGERAKHN